MNPKEPKRIQKGTTKKSKGTNNSQTATRNQKKPNRNHKIKTKRKEDQIRSRTERSKLLFKTWKSAFKITKEHMPCNQRANLCQLCGFRQPPSVRTVLLCGALRVPRGGTSPSRPATVSNTCWTPRASSTPRGPLVHHSSGKWHGPGFRGRNSIV